MTLPVSRSLVRSCSLVGLLLLSFAACAHEGHANGEAPSFFSGFMHPFTGADHMLAMIAVGIWSATGHRRPWIAPIGFVSMLVIGAIAAAGGWLTGITSDTVDLVVAASVLVLGALIAGRMRFTPALALALVAGFAFFHGAAHGMELQLCPSALIGMAGATFVLHVAGLALGFALRQQSQRWHALAGGGIALAGLGLSLGLLTTLA